MLGVPMVKHLGWETLERALQSLLKRYNHVLRAFGGNDFKVKHTQTAAKRQGTADYNKIGKTPTTLCLKRRHPGGFPVREAVEIKIQMNAFNPKSPMESNAMTRFLTGALVEDLQRRYITVTNNSQPNSKKCFCFTKINTEKRRHDS